MHITNIKYKDMYFISLDTKTLHETVTTTTSSYWYTISRNEIFSTQATVQARREGEGLWVYRPPFFLKRSTILGLTD